MNIRIALIGDFDAVVTAHQAIPLALQCNSEAIGRCVEHAWIATDAVEAADLKQFDGIWCVPASPYRDFNGAIAAINTARVHDIAFLGTCGGYQHAVLEYARNVLGFAFADNTEINPAAVMPLISELTCRLVEESDAIQLYSPSKLFSIYQAKHIVEKYHCSFGVNPQYLPLFEDADLKFTGLDNLGEPRAFELLGHRFFIGTAYQPERSALIGETHPLIEAFLAAAGES